MARQHGSGSPGSVVCYCLQVFSIGEEVKETNDSGFMGTVPTICTQLLADNSLLQVSTAKHYHA